MPFFRVVVKIFNLSTLIQKFSHSKLKKKFPTLLIKFSSLEFKLLVIWVHSKISSHLSSF